MLILSGNTQFQKLPLSGSTGGRRVKVAATVTPGTLVHTGPTDPTMTDELWLDAHNTGAAAVDLTIQWGGTTAPDDSVVMTIPPKSGLSLVIPGHVLVGNATALIVRAFASTANVLTVGGYVNRVQ